MRRFYESHSLWPVSPFTDISTQHSSQFQNNKTHTMPCGSYINENYKAELKTTVETQYTSALCACYASFLPHTPVLHIHTPRSLLFQLQSCFLPREANLDGWLLLRFSRQEILSNNEVLEEKGFRIFLNHIFSITML